MERVEVFRGPASVLYGSEAIGGVLNLIYRVPDYFGQGTDVSGNLGYRFSSADTQHKGFFNINGNVDNLGFMVNGSYRKAQDYTAPAGSFGNITLAEDTPVLDSGVQDQNFNIFFGLRLPRDKLYLPGWPVSESLKKAPLFVILIAIDYQSNWVRP